MLRRLTAPAYFGEIGLLERIPRTATVTRSGECLCEQIDGSVLLEALNGAPPSRTFIENTRSRLQTTHPSLEPAATVHVWAGRARAGSPADRS